MSIVAIIPARSGSKGLKNKNILPFNGKPLFVWSILEAKKTNIFDEIIVTTDSKKYGKLAKNYGCKIIYRDRKLSNNKTPMFDVIKDVLSKEKRMNYFFLLQPTSPLRKHKHILEAYKLFIKNKTNFDFLVSVKRSNTPSILINKIDDDLSLKYFNKDYSKYRRQNNVEFSPNGAIFIAKSKEYLKNKHFFGSRSMAYIMDNHSSIDIDDEIDFELAKLISKKYEK